MSEYQFENVASRRVDAARANTAINEMVGDGDVLVVPPVMLEPVGEVRLEGMVDGKRVAVQLPRFSPDQFPAAMRPLIPAEDHFYVDNDAVLLKIAVAWDLGMTPMLWGEPGSGKTEALKHMAALMRVPFVRVQFEQTTEVTQLAGKMHLNADGTWFSYARFVKFLPWPNVTALDEWNAADDEVRFWVRPVFDDENAVSLDMHDGRVVTRNKWCFIAPTGNPDWTSRNSGTVPLAEADRDRMYHVTVQYPSPSTEYQILAHAVEYRKLAVSPAQVVNTIGLWAQMRGACYRGETTLTAGTRSMLNFINALSVMPPMAAFRMVFAGVDPSQVDPLESLIDANDLAFNAPIIALDVKLELTAEQQAQVDNNKWEV